jgi:aryl-alcohol dehydrogenase-like predicted oxidoreductase
LNINKIIIGVTQFGMPYGIMNKSKNDRKKKLKQILNFSKKKNIKALYTSKYYGNSNKLLGFENLHHFKIFSKFKSEDLLNEKFILELDKVRNTLGKNTIILMLDGFEKLSVNKALKVYDIIIKLKKNKYISKFGYSIYDFKNLQKICKNFKPDILQCPYNVIDRRLEQKGLLEYLKFNKIEVHVRSIFLQGLLIADPSRLPKKFLKWKKIFQIFKNKMSYYQISNLEGCLNFIEKNRCIDKILIGIDNDIQLKEILDAKYNKKIKFPNIYIKNEKLIDPSKW